MKIRESETHTERRLRGDEIRTKIFAVLVFAAPNEGGPRRGGRSVGPRGPKLPSLLRLRLSSNCSPFTSFTYERLCTHTHACAHACTRARHGAELRERRLKVDWHEICRCPALPKLIVFRLRFRRRRIDLTTRRVSVLILLISKSNKRARANKAREPSKGRKPVKSYVIGLTGFIFVTFNFLGQRRAGTSRRFVPFSTSCETLYLVNILSRSLSFISRIVESEEEPRASLKSSLSVLQNVAPRHRNIPCLI